ncbi:MAG TPA: glycosyltransferase [Longimicrobiaceae bacterium]|nr:glycosyltransferase [Longimicrobiaceae bacterium]
MIRSASIVCLSLVDWSFNRQIPHEVAQALAAAGNRVLFVENTGVRRAALRDASRLWSRLRNWWRAHGRAWPVGRGIDVLSPVLLPLPESRAATGINTRVLVRSVRGWMGDAPGPLIVVTFSPAPLARSVIRALGPDLVVYYCVDLLAASSPAARYLRWSERALLAEADLVLVSSGLLHRMAAEISPRVELLECGAHVEEFVRARRSRGEAHPGFPACCGPVMGFIGSLRSATDLDLLVHSAELAPDLQFVLVGPRFVDASALARLPNVRLLDAIPHAQVAHFMARFDVGILPYAINPFTAAILPVKLKEYLAAGLPVVATSLPEVRRFDRRHPGLVRFADDPAAFVLALREALARDTPELAAHRVTVARRYDWSRQMARMDELMQEALGRRPAPVTAAR